MTYKNLPFDEKFIFRLGVPCGAPFFVFRRSIIAYHRLSLMGWGRIVIVYRIGYTIDHRAKHERKDVRE